MAINTRRKYTKKEIQNILSIDRRLTVGPNDQQAFETFVVNATDTVRAIIESTRQNKEPDQPILVRAFPDNISPDTAGFVPSYSFPFCCVAPIDTETGLTVTDSDKFDYYVACGLQSYSIKTDDPLKLTKELHDHIIGKYNSKIITTCVSVDYPSLPVKRCLWCGEPVGNVNIVDSKGRMYCSDYCKKQALQTENEYQQIVETTNKFNELTAAGNLSDADKLKNNGIYSCCIDEGIHVNPDALDGLYFMCGPSATLKNVIYNNHCLFCGKLIPATKNKGSKYCSDRCRHRATNERNKSKKNC